MPPVKKKKSCAKTHSDCLSSVCAVCWRKKETLGMSVTAWLKIFSSMCLKVTARIMGITLVWYVMALGKHWQISLRYNKCRIKITSFKISGSRKQQANTSRETPLLLLRKSNQDRTFLIDRWLMYLSDLCDWERKMGASKRKGEAPVKCKRQKTHKII